MREIQQKIHCDVVVVGGGPAGATAARYLAARGVDTVLVEKDLAFHKPCGGGLIRSAFDAFDLPKDLIKKQVETIKIVSPTHREADVDIADYPLTIVNRVAFDARLRELAQADGARVIEGKAYGVATGDRVTVSVRQADAHLAIDARYLIAADGVNSTIRKHLRGEKPSRILTQYVDLPNAESAACQFWFGRKIAPGYYAWIFPHHDGVNAGVCSRDEKQIRHHMRAFMQEAELEQGTARIKGYYIPDWGRTVFYDRGVFFVGDSAAMVAPFTYEGIDYAMRSAVLAAEAILAGDPSQYATQWRAQYQKKFRFLQFLQRLFLRSDWLTEKMVTFYQNPRFQRGVIGYWSGTKKPVTPLVALWKVFKLLVRNLRVKS